MKRAALAILAAAAIAGCGSTVILGTLPAPPGSTDLAQPRPVDFAGDAIDGILPGDFGFDFGLDGGAIDLAH
jgi:hypothetical protein